jgi:hypothetical protein
MKRLMVLVMVLMVFLMVGCVMMTANMPTKSGPAKVRVFRVFQDVNFNYFEGGSFSYSTSSQPLADNLLILSQLAKTVGELYTHQTSTPIAGPVVTAPTAPVTTLEGTK